MTASQPGAAAPRYLIPGAIARRLGGGAIYLERRVAVFLLFGFASGLPLGLVGETFRIWLTDAKIDMAVIGMTSLVGTAYSIKYLWAPVVDHLGLGALTRRFGRRRGWMLAMLAGMAVLAPVMALTGPGVSLALTVTLAVGIAFLSATFDIAVDAFRIELLSERQLAGGTAVHSAGWYLGAKFLAGFVTLTLAHELGWSVAYLLSAAGLALGILAVLVTPEPVRRDEAEIAERRADADAFLAGRPHLSPRAGRVLAMLYVMVAGPFVEMVRRFGGMLAVLLAFVIFFKFQDALAGNLSGPFVRIIGYEKDVIGTIYKGFGLVAIFVGMFAGGLMMSWLGLVRALWVAAILQILSNLGFAWLAVMQELIAGAPGLAGLDSLGAGLTAQVSGHIVNAKLTWLAAAIGFENFASGLGNVIFVVFLSKLVHNAYTATQYALLSAFALTARSFLAAPAGVLSNAVGWVDFFIISALAGLPGLVLLWWIARRGLAGAPAGHAKDA